MAFEPDMKLTSEFVEIMGGKMEAQPFRLEKKILVMGSLGDRNKKEKIKIEKLEREKMRSGEKGEKKVIKCILKKNRQKSENIILVF